VKKIHKCRLQKIATYKESNKQLITKQMTEKLNNFHDW